MLNDIKAKWTGDSDQLTLKNINLQLKPGQLLAVIGPVGSGKSSLLSAILQELPVTSGEVKVHGKVGYASQQPWVFSGTVRQNILFGRPYKEDIYDKTIQVCALEKDLKLLPHGDMTLVGDRGVTLSGGQKARINLARAVYHDADIYLLDDPLSAVDSEVGRHLFNRCIQGTLRNKARILVTHQLQYLQEADQIMVLLKGEQVATGTYTELQQSGIDFTKLLGKEESEEDMAVSPFFSGTSANGLGTNPLKAEADEKDAAAPLLEEEDRMTGTVGWKVYRDYFTAGAGVKGFLFAMFAIISFSVLYFMSDWWLAYWARTEEQYLAAKHNWILASNGYNTTFFNVSNVGDMVNETSMPTNSSTAFPLAPPDTHFYIYVLTAFTAGALFLGVLGNRLLFLISVKSSTNLHNDMFNAIIRAPIRFFDTNPVGRVLNRFSKDIGQLDEVFPWSFTQFVQGSIGLCMMMIVSGVINPWVFIPTLPLLLLFMYIRKYYLSTSRDIKRLEGTTRSPVFSHLSATLQGLWTIRAFGAQESFQQEFDAHQDLHSEAWFLYISCGRWMAVRVDILVSLFITAVAFCSVLASQALDGGLVGLSVTYALILTGRFQWIVRQSAEVENLMTSAERVLTYTKLEPEAPLASITKPHRDWPQDGGIELEDATFSYSEDGPDVLKNLGVVIQPQEKIGIVGRTGAGKSSLMQMLFRMAEPQGTVRIDGVDVTKIGLHDLRKKISVIPQDPVLFSGSLRRNLDPFNNFTDQQLWSVVEEVQLKQAVEDLQGKLESEMAESGTNFSVGQRQLVCLARALLRKNRILIIDEATANVDPRTDQLIQETIREKFKNCTVLTIAHRINTVIDSDRIMVLQEGRVQEMGEAHALLQDRDGVFTAMVDQSGTTLAAELREAARRCYTEKHGTDQVSVDKFVSIIGRETSV
ncbi:ATP-binding cassette sub-family C member 4-like [Branchiostoma lanceolatum]|uniref:ATP-binding cassette sub-family C member 4-like n=1 Tax=Branchiostoma lanceolatum TaxID=7740 RepID=UPI0034566D54